MAMWQRPGDVKGVHDEFEDRGSDLEQSLQSLHPLRWPLAQIGQAACLDLSSLARGFTQQDGR